MGDTPTLNRETRATLRLILFARRNIVAMVILFAALNLGTVGLGSIASDEYSSGRKSLEQARRMVISAPFSLLLLAALVGGYASTTLAHEKIRFAGHAPGRRTGHWRGAYVVAATYGLMVAVLGLVMALFVIGHYGLGLSRGLVTRGEVVHGAWICLVVSLAAIFGAICGRMGFGFAAVAGLLALWILIVESALMSLVHWFAYILPGGFQMSMLNDPDTPDKYSRSVGLLLYTRSARTGRSSNERHAVERAGDPGR